MSQQNGTPSVPLDKCFNCKEYKPSSLSVKFQTIDSDSKSKNHPLEVDKRPFKNVFLLTEIPAATDLKPTGSERRGRSRANTGEPLSESEIMLHIDTTGRVKKAFPEFFPRDELLCRYTDFQPLHRANADPILCSWMVFFGRQTTKF